MTKIAAAAVPARPRMARRVVTLVLDVPPDAPDIDETTFFSEYRFLAVDGSEVETYTREVRVRNHADVPTGADIELVEHVGPEDFREIDALGVIKPNTVRINGMPVLTVKGQPITVHPVSLNDSDNKVTLTLYARSVRIALESL